MGANLEGVRESPVELTLPNHLVYSTHEYGPLEYPQPWFTPTISSQDLEQIWVRTGPSSVICKLPCLPW